MPCKKYYRLVHRIIRSCRVKVGKEIFKLLSVNVSRNCQIVQVVFLLSYRICSQCFFRLSVDDIAVRRVAAAM